MRKLIKKRDQTIHDYNQFNAICAAHKALKAVESWCDYMDCDGSDCYLHDALNKIEKIYPKLKKHGVIHG
jgi:hypothetical protein